MGERGVCISAVLAVALTASARADQISQSFDIPMRVTNWNSQVAFAKFDPNLGILTAVVLRLSAGFEATMLAENRASGPALITGIIYEKVSVTPEGLSEVFLDAQNSDTGPLLAEAYDPSDGPFTGSDTVAFVLPPTQRFFEKSFPSLDFAAFTGSGDLAFSVVGLSTFMAASSQGSLALRVDARSAATIELVYEYIPEPASLGLLLFGALLVRRRRSC